MIILSFANILTRATKPRYDEDMVDRLNNRFIAYALIAAGITIFGDTWGGNPVQCWDKPNWDKSWSEYASDYCFIEGTYFVPLNASLPNEDGYKNLKKLSFYQWTPFVFTLLGVMFTLPRSLWSFINWASSFHMTAILTEGSKAKKTGESRDFVKFSTAHIINILKRRRFTENLNFVKRLWSKMFGSYYLTSWYIVIKLLNIACVIIALVAVSNLVADDTKSFFGIETIKTLTHGNNWRKTGLFPRVTICRFKIREASIYETSVMASKVTQCVLSTNMYIEKIFIIVWYGLMTLLWTNVLNLIRFIFLLIETNRESFLYNLMMPCVECLFPDFDKDTKWETKLRRDFQHMENKFRHLKNVKKEGNPAEIEVAEHQFLEAQQNVYDCQKKALKKPSQKRAKFYDYLHHDIHGFVQHLGADGYLTIRLLYANAGNFIAGATIAKVFWKLAKQQEKNHS